ncbi:hypothetical protein MAR_035479 [Mya arenaria]|uniref:Uncharacterized protein n=1 Tax=Mya arenaria TaxID=6604 RepID=A0ABY7EP90_MYAAR|nr:hypothetical protein MAR_035479 [Mya arenaria]
MARKNEDQYFNSKQDSIFGSSLLTYLGSCVFFHAAITEWTSSAPSLAATNADGTIIASETIADNSPVGTILFKATPVASGGTASYALTTDANGKGTISSTGVVTLAIDQLIYFETTPTLVEVEQTPTVTKPQLSRLPVLPLVIKTTPQQVRHLDLHRN